MLIARFYRVSRSPPNQTEVETSGRARPRLRVPRITVRYVAEGAEAVGLLLDVSRAGVYVEAAELPREGAVVAMQFESPDGTLVDLRGEVRWSEDREGRASATRGFGVRLREPPRAYREFVSWLLSQNDEKGEQDGRDGEGEL